ncbi:hypothetical protein QQ045_031906 [Rhodiola kirilowii]
MSELRPAPLCPLPGIGPREGKVVENDCDWDRLDESHCSSSSSSSRVTLSGVLNFIDGIWSASGGERLIVFTTNFVDKLDGTWHALNCPTTVLRGLRSWQRIT